MTTSILNNTLQVNYYRMKPTILIVCSLIAASLAIPWPIQNTKKSELAEVEETLNEVEALLKDLQESETVQPIEFPGRNAVSNNTPPQPMEEMLLHTENLEAATAEIKSVGGRVKMFLGDELIVANVPSDFINKRNSFASASAHITESASPETLTYVQAYWMSREKKIKPPPESLSWTEKTAPVVLPREFPFTDEANSPYRKTLTGRIAFAAIIVSGPGRLAISTYERNKILSEIQSGLIFWINNAPNMANLEFHLFSGYPKITAADSNFCSSYPACHDVFVNPALKALGFRTGRAGKDAVAQYIKDRSGADGAYIGFFSKYRQKHFAYAYFGGGPLYMQYSNDGWGPDQIDRVFAHETGHVFNAPDEYTSCDCNKNYGQGMCPAKNGNCVKCTGRQTSCIMDGNKFSICQYTKKHLGWCN